MNWKWLLVMDADPYEGDVPSDVRHYVFFSDAEAMDFLCEHNPEWLVLEIVKNSSYKGDLDA